MPFILQPKLELSGKRQRHDESARDGVRVTATQVGGITNCTKGPLTNTVSTTSDRNGNYLLLVPRGTYQLDVEPGPMSQWPRLTVPDSVFVAHATVQPIKMQAGDIVQVTVFGV